MIKCRSHYWHFWQKHQLLFIQPVKLCHSRPEKLLRNTNCFWCCTVKYKVWVKSAGTSSYLNNIRWGWHIVGLLWRGECNPTLSDIRDVISIGSRKLHEKIFKWDRIMKISQITCFLSKQIFLSFHLKYFVHTSYIIKLLSLFFQSPENVKMVKGDVEQPFMKLKSR